MLVICRTRWDHNLDDEVARDAAVSMRRSLTASFAFALVYIFKEGTIKIFLASVRKGAAKPSIGV